jgi:hypothetical protein
VGTRDLFRTGPGPDSGGSKAFRAWLLHVPEKSGMDAADCVPLLPDPIAGVTSCPAAGVIAAVANIMTKRKSRCLCMTCLVFMV